MNGHIELVKLLIRHNWEERIIQQPIAFPLID